MELEKHQYDTTGRPRRKAPRVQGAGAEIVTDARDRDFDKFTAKRLSKVPLPDQGMAFKAAIQEPNEISVGIRGGGPRHGFHNDQENHPKPARSSSNPEVQPSPGKCTPKVPLAEQGTVFQAALQQSTRFSPTVRGAPRKSSHTGGLQIKGAAAAAEQQRTAGQEKQRQKTAKTKPKRKWQQENSEYSHY
ncbi:MAG: hypothetical protein L6R40_003277 [Gallowayella cf. fulva]|nr:MAG: hypothetical protein L6R40_003277 [Xanthomendoza cf. fulva]